ncbi:MAG: hypothetical protein ABSG59_08575 [Verrucomicrobiota bacterium]
MARHFDFSPARDDGIVPQLSGATSAPETQNYMHDVVYIAVMIAFFMLAALYVRACEKL